MNCSTVRDTCPRRRKAGGLRLLALLPLAACSMMLTEHRRTLNLLDEELAPPSTAGKVALAPVALPVGLVAFAADLAVVHPVASVDDAWADTVDLLWRPRDETPLRKALFAPVAAVATPFVLVGDWAGRWLFPIASRSEPQVPSSPPAPAEERR